MDSLILILAVIGALALYLALAVAVGTWLGMQDARSMTGALSERMERDGAA